MEKFTGTVIWFANDKGFGFISRDDEDTDIFVYWKNINNEVNGFRTLQADQKVSFGLGENDKGLQAIDVDVMEVD